MLKFSSLTLIYLIIFQNHSFAYIDPGTGGIIIQAILGFIAAAGATIVLYWRKFKAFLQKIFNFKKKID